MQFGPSNAVRTPVHSTQLSSGIPHSPPLSKRTSSQPTVRAPEQEVIDAYTEVLQKLFLPRADGTSKCLYRKELAEAAAKLGSDPVDLVNGAINELKFKGGDLEFDGRGRVIDAKGVGNRFAAIDEIIQKNVELYVIHSSRQLEDASLPISKAHRKYFREILIAGETAMLMIAIRPPAEAAVEIKAVTNEHLNGVMALWLNPEVRANLPLTDALRDYIRAATVRVLCTGHNERANHAARSLNEVFEREGGFEDHHWSRVIKQAALGEKQESLKGALKVCLPILVASKVLEKFLPGQLHAIGGALDDLFGGVIPGVSQSLGDKKLPFAARVRHAMPEIIGGLVTLPAAYMLGTLAAGMFEGAPGAFTRVCAGLIFASACCLGTVGTSAVAFARSFRDILRLSSSEIAGEQVRKMSFWERAKMAFREAVLDVPLRVGQNLIGVPLQLGLGVAAGLGGFFHNGMFVAVEGMAETALGAAAAYLYPLFVTWRNRSQLRNA